MDLEQQEKKEVGTPKIKELEYDLGFSGGPYGMFNYKNSESEMVGPGEMMVATKDGLGEKQSFDAASENYSWDKDKITTSAPVEVTTSNADTKKENPSQVADSNKLYYVLTLLVIVVVGIIYFKKVKKMKDNNHIEKE